MFSKEECLKWQSKKDTKKPCCLNPKIQHFSVQKRCGDEISNIYKICVNCNKKIIY